MPDTGASRKRQIEGCRIRGQLTIPAVPLKRFVAPETARPGPRFGSAGPQKWGTDSAAPPHGASHLRLAVSHCVRLRFADDSLGARFENVAALAS